MGRELFGTDGVRGIAGEYPLDEAGAVRIGMAVAAHFAKPGERILIASDPRESSEWLVKSVTEGLNKAGANVTFIGVMPTPGLAYLTRETAEAVAGVMITASHNPYNYNGVKVFDSNGDKLSDKTEAEINKFIEEGAPEQAIGSADEDLMLVSQYEDFLVNSAGGTSLGGMLVATDSANGASSGLAERVFTRLGAAVTPMFDTPNGRNINDACGATDTTALSRDIMIRGLHCGIALDGDADRLMLCDSEGRVLNGDYIMYILAVSSGVKGVVLTVMSNLGLENSLREKGIEVVRTAVGDRYVLEGLAKSGYSLGGEQAGHIILPNLLATGDGLLAAVQTLKAVAKSGKTLAEWRNEVTMLPQSLVNFPLADRSLLERQDVKDYVQAQTDELGSSGRILIRPSGTEPLARVMVEAPDAEARAQKIATKLEEIL